MPFRFELDDRHGLLAIRFSGTLTDDVMTTFFRETPLYTQRFPVRAGLVDFSAVTGLDVSTDIVQKLVALPDPLPDPIPRVVIAPSDLLFGLSRMYKSLATEKREALHITRTAQAALDHLQIHDAVQFVALSPDVLT